MAFKCFLRYISLFALLLLAGCATDETIVNNVVEKDANEIIVFLSSKGIDAQKVLTPSSGIGANAPTNLYSIVVSSSQSIEAMAILNKVGLPRPQGITLLDLFAKSGLMSSTMEDTVRYQAGVAEQLKNTIRKIDGILDADVQISYPPATTTQAPGTVAPKITAAVYIKHQGILEDPNSHLEVKIKRLVSGSINGLDYNNVFVVSDRSRFADITLTPEGEMVGAKPVQTYASIWGLVMTQGSVTRFKFIFSLGLLLLLALFGGLGWLIYRFYPEIRTLVFHKKSAPPEIPPGL
jgi:type III secretion protein J